MIFGFTSFLPGCIRKNDVEISVNDNGKILRIKVDANKNDKDIRYRGSFDVNDLSKTQKDSIVNYVLDSLRIRTNSDNLKN